MKKTIFYLLCDIRKWLIVYTIFFIFFFTVSYVNKDILYYIISYPLNLGTAYNNIFIYSGIMEAFLSDILLSVYIAFLLSIPILLFCVYKFISPSLYYNEKKTTILFMLFGIMMLVLSFIIMYFLILPRAFIFFITYNSIAKPMLKISNYISTFFGFIFAFGISFQLPLILFILIKLKIFSYKTLSKYRKNVIVAIFIFSAIITPPDVISQIICATIFIAIYEITNFFIKKNVKSNISFNKKKISYKQGKGNFYFDKNINSKDAKKRYIKPNTKRKKLYSNY